MPKNDTPAGHPMNAIAHQFKAQDHPVDPSPPQTSAPAEETVRRPADPDAAADRVHAAVRFSFLSDHIAPPAIFIDRHLEVRWVAQGGADLFSKALEAALRAESDRNIFVVLRNPSVQQAEMDWTELFAFIYGFLRRTTPEDVFASGATAIAPHGPVAVPEPPPRDRLGEGFALASGRLKSQRPAGQTPWRVFGLSVEQGTLILMRPGRVSEADALTASAPPAVDEPHDQADLKALVAVLSVRLNESHTIADTMLPDAFCRWMQGIWAHVDSIATALGGRRVASDGAHTRYVFASSAGRNPIFSAVCCAATINARLLPAERPATDDPNWMDDIHMNMGISDAMAEPDQPVSDIVGALGLPGGALNQAALASGVAGKGEIWITRNAVIQLPRPLIDRLILGVEHNQRLRRNSFIRIGDHRSDGHADAFSPDARGLTITRIVSVDQR